MIERFLEKMRSSSAERRLDEEEIYAAIFSEVTRGELRPGPWTRAVQEADGDPSKIMGVYIRHRAQTIKDERRLTQTQSDKFKRVDKGTEARTSKKKRPQDSKDSHPGW